MDIPLSYFNFLDVFLLILIGFSMLVGFVRGFVREFFSVMAWGTAFLIALQDLSFPKEILSRWIKDPNILQFASYLSVFCICLIFFLSVLQIVASYVQGSVVRSIDRSLGLVFGFVRGVGLIATLYLGSLFFVSPDTQPIILRTSKSLPFLEKAALVLEKVLPESIKNKKDLKVNLESILKNQFNHEDLLRKLSSPDSQAQ